MRHRVRQKANWIRKRSLESLPRWMRGGTPYLGYAAAQNFGDLLSPVIVESILGEGVAHATLKGADIVGLGSLLTWLEESRNPRNPFVWGSGFISEGTRWAGRAIRPRAVRGHLTLERVSHLAEGEVALGDPGLLISKIFPDLKSTPPTIDLAIIPHYVDAKLPVVGAAVDRNPSARIIDVRRPPVVVLQEIARSRVVVSSSLHGLICADALGIPNIWVPMSDNVVGGSYKFRDYYSSLGKEASAVELLDAVDAPESVVTAWTPIENLETMQERLLAAFPKDELSSLKKSLRG